MAGSSTTRLWVLVVGGLLAVAALGWPALTGAAMKDPEWGQVDPAAGKWFPDMALELARNAVP